MKLFLSLRLLKNKKTVMMRKSVKKMIQMLKTLNLHQLLWSSLLFDALIPNLLPPLLVLHLTSTLTYDFNHPHPPQNMLNLLRHLSLDITLALALMRILQVPLMVSLNLLTTLTHFLKSRGSFIMSNQMNLFFQPRFLHLFVNNYIVRDISSFTEQNNIKLMV